MRADLMEEGSFDEAIHGVDGVFHTASPVLNKVIKRRIHIPKQSDTWQNIPKENAECVIIGSGIVGLAVARELSLKGKDVLVLDSAHTFGTATSSCNSEVIHAGIYYPPDSLEARFCVRGRNLLYRYCSQRGIPHDRIDKLVVATGVALVKVVTEYENHGDDGSSSD